MTAIKAGIVGVITSLRRLWTIRILRNGAVSPSEKNPPRQITDEAEISHGGGGLKIIIRNSTSTSQEFCFRKLSRSVTEIELVSLETSVRLQHGSSATIQAGRAAAVLIDLNGRNKKEIPRTGFAGASRE